MLSNTNPGTVQSDVLFTPNQNNVFRHVSRNIQNNKTLVRAHYYYFFFSCKPQVIRDDKMDDDIFIIRSVSKLKMCIPYYCCSTAFAYSTFSEKRKRQSLAFETQTTTTIILFVLYKTCFTQRRTKIDNSPRKRESSSKTNATDNSSGSSSSCCSSTTVGVG